MRILLIFFLLISCAGSARGPESQLADATDGSGKRTFQRPQLPFRVWSEPTCGTAPDESIGVWNGWMEREYFATAHFLDRADIWVFCQDTCDGPALASITYPRIPDKLRHEYRYRFAPTISLCRHVALTHFLGHAVGLKYDRYDRGSIMHPTSWQHEVPVLRSIDKQALLQGV